MTEPSSTSTSAPRSSATAVDHALEVLRLVGRGGEAGCGVGTPDGPCPNRPVTSVGMAAAHPEDGAARWLVPTWTPVCVWHRDAVVAGTDGEPVVSDLWAARGGPAGSHPRVSDPMRRGLARWLEATTGSMWSGELSL